MDCSEGILSVEYFLNIIGDADSEETLRKNIAKPVHQLINNKRFSILKHTEKVNSFFVGDNERGGFFHESERARANIFSEDVLQVFLVPKKRLFIFSPSKNSMLESANKLKQSFDKVLKDFSKVEKKIKNTEQYFPKTEDLESLGTIPEAYQAIAANLKEFDIESMTETDQVKLTISMSEIENQLIKINKLKIELKEVASLFNVLKAKKSDLENEIVMFRENELTELEYVISSFKDGADIETIKNCIDLVERAHKSLNNEFSKFESTLFSFASEATKKEYLLHELGQN